MRERRRRGQRGCCLRLGGNLRAPRPRRSAWQGARAPPCAVGPPELSLTSKRPLWPPGRSRGLASAPPSHSSFPRAPRSLLGWYQSLSGHMRHTFTLQETSSPPSVVLAGSRSQTSKALVTKRADQGGGWPRALGRLRGLQTFRECCKPRVTRPPRRPPSRIAHRTPSQGRERNPAPDRGWPDAGGSRPVLAKGVIRADAGERGRVPRCVQWPWRRQGPGPRWASRPVTEEDTRKSVGEEKTLLS